jgi:hypothetical protein
MHLNAKLGGCLLAALVGASLLPGGVAGAAPPGAGATPSTLRGAATGGIRTITLLTGDRVTVLGADLKQVTIQPGKGREKIGFFRSTVRGHLQIVPTDAAPLLAAGRLDRRLFDVTTLLAFGYDDKRPNLPLIMTARGGVNAMARPSCGSFRPSTASR